VLALLNHRVSHLHCFAPEYLVCYTGDRASMGARTAEKLGRFPQRGSHTEYTDALDEGRDFEQGDKGVPRCPRRVRNRDRKHQFARPDMLNIARLLVFECSLAEGAQNVHRCNRLQVMAKASALSYGPELVRNRRATGHVRDDAAWQRPPDLELERKEMTACLEGVAMLLLALEKGPVVLTDNVCRGGICGGGRVLGWKGKISLATELECDGSDGCRFCEKKSYIPRETGWLDVYPSASKENIVMV
jgi:hypothetical protein